MLAAWDAELAKVTDLNAPLGEIFGHTPDPARFPLEELLVVDLDAADPFASVDRLFPRE